jgi:hypothetical protein
MTPGDVQEEILGMRDGLRLDFEDEGHAIVVWGSLIQRLKPDQGYMPMSPEEVERARRILRWVSAALETAHARRPAHLRPVEPDGR